MSAKKKIDKNSEQSIPRFVFSISDTKTEIDGPNGRVYYNITIGFENKQQLMESQSQLDGSSELLNVIETFFETVKKFDDDNYTAVKVEN